MLRERSVCTSSLHSFLRTKPHASLSERTLVSLRRGHARSTVGICLALILEMCTRCTQQTRQKSIAHGVATNSKKETLFNPNVAFLNSEIPRGEIRVLKFPLVISSRLMPRTGGCVCMKERDRDSGLLPQTLANMHRPKQPASASSEQPVLRTLSNPGPH